MDALQERQPFDTPAKELLLRAQNGELRCCFTANAATDIFYLFNKARNLQAARSALDYLLTCYNVISVTQEDCIDALATAIDDFEDALAAVCALKAEVDFIVTRDEAFLKANSPVQMITPGRLLEKLSC
jgi:predicted nucleic acid-binding protein